MKKLTATLIMQLFMLAIISMPAYSQLSLPRVASPASTLTQTIGISTVTVSYSRPSVKGREVWGKLVPYGWNIQGFGLGNSAPWRAGANENTTISFSHPVKVEGKDIAAGIYGLFFVIYDENNGEVILSKDSKSWGSFFYDSTHDVMRAKISLKSVSPTELLTYDFVNLTKNSGDLVLDWEKKQFPVKIEYDVDKIVLENAAAELKGSTGFMFQNFVNAAGYTAQNNVGLDQGLVWINNAIAQRSTFNSLSIKSNILKLMNKPSESEKAMTDALAVATEFELNNYGYALLNQKQEDKAIEVLTLNTQRFPKSANTWDSLGEAYALKGDKKNAIVNFKKSLSLNPAPNVKANSEKYLKQLGGM